MKDRDRKKATSGVGRKVKQKSPGRSKNRKIKPGFKIFCDRCMRSAEFTLKSPKRKIAIKISGTATIEY